MKFMGAPNNILICEITLNYYFYVVYLSFMNNALRIFEMIAHECIVLMIFLYKVEWT